MNLWHEGEKDEKMGEGSCYKAAIKASLKILPLTCKITLTKSV